MNPTSISLHKFKAKRLPLNWEFVPVGDVILESKYGTNQASVKNGNIPVVGMKDLKDGKIITNNLVRTNLSIEDQQKYLLSKGDILINRTNSFDLVGKVGIFDSDERVAYASYLVKLKLNMNKALPNFLNYWLNSFIAQKNIKRIATRAIGQANVNPTELKKHCYCPIPPLTEQKGIANLLSTWDEAIDKIERLIQAKEKKLKGKIQRIMGRQAIVEKKWPVLHLSELFTEVTRKVGDKELIPYSISAGIGFVSQREKWGKNISGSQHKKYTHLKAGEFSYNKGNSKRYKQGCVYLLKEGEICVPNVFISFKPKPQKIVPEFFEHYFIADYHARELKRYITSSARSDGLLNLNKKDFFKILVPCPSRIEQKAIAETLTFLQKEIDLLKQLAEKYKLQKRGLMQKLLSGEWRVRC